ncbi:hypothetical protein FHT40_003383 [Mycolicibacterium sp. BK556]|nr:hypothetical protein [Mycolicibacterium sp. BK556]MBB3633917.1 hypothetical protein [Mycolicibacterium sp. BK607]MBB3751499.1 hypothetical protein [Mycolicibacterium sp. BK634]TDO12028.1 hypothetical protein EV580_3752 [Mycobacterium sp. BK086]
MITTIGIAGVIAAAGLAVAPVASADVDPCSAAVSSSRCLGPAGVTGFAVPNSNAGGGHQNGPYGPWGSVPPLG